MESIFVGDAAARAAFLRHTLQAFGATYICLWSYSPLPSNCLVFLDGFYDEGKIGKAGRLAFNEYCGSINYYIMNECVPGFAFKNNIPYLELKLHYLQPPLMLATQMQIQFYQEAGIETAVFMGCATGEIELGFSNDHQPPLQVNMQEEIERWFPADFSRSQTVSSSFLEIPPSADAAEAILQETLLNYSYNYSNSTIINMTSTTNQQIPYTPPNISNNIVAPRPPSSQQVRHHGYLAAAFTAYRPHRSSSNSGAAQVLAANHKPNLFKRSLSFFRNINLMRPRHDHDHHDQFHIQKNHPHMHHVLAERKRREKFNHSFQILRNLLPQVFKKDKASILSSTAEYVSSLKSQMEELQTRNAMLEMQISTAQTESLGVGQVVQPPPPSTERVSVEIVSPSTTRMTLDLRISLRSEECSLSEMIARILGFLKQHKNLSLLCLQSNSTTILDSTSLHVLLLTIKLHQGSEFDESGFQEAVRRVVEALPH